MIHQLFSPVCPFSEEYQEIVSYFLKSTSRKRGLVYKIFNKYNKTVYYITQRESNLGVQWGQGNPNPRVQHSSGKQGFDKFATGTVGPRVGIFRLESGLEYSEAIALARNCQI